MLFQEVDRIGLVRASPRVATQVFVSELTLVPVVEHVGDLSFEQVAPQIEVLNQHRSREIRQYHVRQQSQRSSRHARVEHERNEQPDVLLKLLTFEPAEKLEQQVAL